MTTEADRRARLWFAVASFSKDRTPDRVAAALNSDPRAVDRWASSLTRGEQAQLDRSVDALVERDVDVCFASDPDFPAGLEALRKPPAVLFTWGNRSLLRSPGVGMCGSRNASAKGLEAARVCGLEVAAHDLAVISGYAKGVDTETHVAALGSGGRTVIVLAEGISYFRKKRAFDEVGLDASRVVVVSQFAPGLRWNVGAAMTRNGVITSLGRALVVVEAGETGGTLNAGLQALAMEKAVLALEFNDGTPLGNQALFEKGALPIRSRQALGRVLDELKTQSDPVPRGGDKLF